MPQVIGGEIGNIKEEEWHCGECKDAGAEHKDTLAKVLMHSALQQRRKPPSIHLGYLQIYVILACLLQFFSYIK